MDKAIQELLDKQAIAELVHNYSRAVDRKDWTLLRDLYTQDGVDDHAALFCGPADDFVKWLEGASAHLDGMAHQVHSILIGVDGDAAWGEAYVTSYNRWPDGKGGFEEFVQGLRYLDTLRREAPDTRRDVFGLIVDDKIRLPSLALGHFVRRADRRYDLGPRGLGHLHNHRTDAPHAAVHENNFTGL